MILSFDSAKWMWDSDGEWLSLRVTDGEAARRFCDNIKDDRTYDAELKEHRQKRSPDANAYCWALIGKVADILRTDKDSVYLMMLKRYGQGGVAKIPNDMVGQFTRAYKYHEKHETAPDEERAQYFRFWIGSSQYNTHEMSVLIDGIVSEAKELGIETMTPEQLSLLKEGWNEVYHKR